MNRRDFIKWIGITGGAAATASMPTGVQGGEFYVPDQSVPGLPELSLGKDGRTKVRWVTVDNIARHLKEGYQYVLINSEGHQGKRITHKLSDTPTGGLMSHKYAVVYRGMTLMGRKI